MFLMAEQGNGASQRARALPFESWSLSGVSGQWVGKERQAAGDKDSVGGAVTG